METKERDGVSEVILDIRFITGVTIGDPDNAVFAAKEMLQKYLEDTPIGDFKRSCLFQLELLKANVNTLIPKSGESFQVFPALPKTCPNCGKPILPDEDIWYNVKDNNKAYHNNCPEE